jgi:hypothetical protein
MKPPVKTANPPRLRSDGSGRMVGERGYVIALTALLILPLMAFTGLAVDLGSWFAYAAKMKQASDAAALAGARYMPDYAKAQTAALTVAKQNGFDPAATPNITINTTKLDDTKLSVDINDNKTPQFFTKLFRTSETIDRSSKAELLRPIPMGSPRNFIGTNTGMPSPWTENFSLNVSGYCSPKEQGDRLTPFSDYSFQGGPFQGCVPGSNGVVNNAEYTPDGYFYVVEMPATFAGTSTLNIQVQGGAWCSSTGTTDTSGTNGQITSFAVRNNDNTDPKQTTFVTSGQGAQYTFPVQVTNGTSGGAFCHDTNSNSAGWVTLASVNAKAGDKFYVQVNTQPKPGNTTVQEGQDSFALRAYTGGSFSPCTSDPADPAYAVPNQCPNVYALTHLGVFLTVPGGQSDFYLASIGTQYSNHTLEVYLFDPGEGSDHLQLIQPDGVVASFTYDVACQDGNFPHTCTGESAPTGGYGPFVSQTQIVTGTSGTQPSANNTSTSKYNDRLLRLTLNLPSNIATAYGGKTWWKIRYFAGTSPSDRTTWSVVIKGDPVRLVP